jgi:hypothetical protein
MPDANIFVDEPMQRLAEYLRDWLNTEYIKAYPPPEGSSPQAIVNGIRAYYTHNAPYDQYPLLSVYRMFEDGSLDSDKDSVTGVITYGLVLPELEGMVPLLVWVKKQIAKALKTWRIEHRACTPVIKSPRYRVEYRTMQNERTQKVHSFLRITLTFIDY